MKTATFAAATLTFTDRFIGWSISDGSLFFHALQGKLTNTTGMTLTGGVSGYIELAGGTNRELKWIPWRRGDFYDLSGFTCVPGKPVSLGNWLSDDMWIPEAQFVAEHTSLLISVTLGAETKTISWDAAEMAALVALAKS